MARSRIKNIQKPFNFRNTMSRLEEKEKCTYCREYGNLPCEECDKKIEYDYPGKEYQELFNHLQDEHGLILLESEMSEIIHIVNKMKIPDREEEMIEMLEEGIAHLNNLDWQPNMVVTYSNWTMNAEALLQSLKPVSK